jgi:hypothetical protein
MWRPLHTPLGPPRVTRRRPPLAAKHRAASRRLDRWRRRRYDAAALVAQGGGLGRIADRSAFLIMEPEFLVLRTTMDCALPHCKLVQQPLRVQ